MKVQWRDTISPLVKYQKTDNDIKLRVFMFAIGMFTVGALRGWVAFYRTQRAFYFRVWRITAALYVPLDEWFYRDFLVWPKRRYIGKLRYPELA